MSLVDQIGAIHTLASQGRTAQEIATATGLEIGDVESVVRGGQQMPTLSDGNPTAPLVRRFPFGFDTPNLATGHAVYTPTIGDILLDAWVEIDTPWNGTSPALCNVGTFTNNEGGFGWFSNLSANVRVDVFGPGQDTAIFGESVLSSGFVSSLQTALLAQALRLSVLPSSIEVARLVPARFIAASPVKVVVSHDGTPTGADVGATQGQATLFLITLS